MSGTRKMEKFELDAFTKAREDELAAKTKGGQLESQAGSAIADPEPGAVVDARDPNANLPARTFEPRAGDTGGAGRPAVPFGRRPESGGPGPADLPGLPFEPRGASSSVANTRGAGADGLERPGTPGGAWVPGEWIPPQQADESSQGDKEA